MPKPDAEAAPDIVTVEAPTASEALEDVTRRFGSDADIVSAGKVLRGGLGGFFARELIQLRVRAKADGDPSQDPDRAGTDDGEGVARNPAVQRLLGSLTDSVDSRERTFATALRQQLGAVLEADGNEPAPEPTPSAPTPSAASAVTAPPPPPASPVEGRSGRIGPAPWLSAPPEGMEQASRVVPAQRVALDPEPADPPSLPDAAGHGQRPDAASLPDAAEPPAPSGTTTSARAQPPPAGWAPPPATARAVVPPSGPSHPPAQPRRRTAGICPVRWAAAAEADGGLPPLVRDALADTDANDDAGCLTAVADAVALLCRPLPGGTPLVVGPRAARLASGLGVPLVSASGPAPEAGPVAAAVGEGRRDWIAWNKGARWVHLVAGGRGWEGLREEQPLAVSWTRPADLPEALTLAAGHGLVLGYDATSRTPRRAFPLDVAIAVRDLLPSR